MSDIKKQIGRNDPCHCGSGKKYKKCCLAADEDAPRLAREQRRKEEEAKLAAAPAQSDREPVSRPVVTLADDVEEADEWQDEEEDEDERNGSWCDAPLRHYPKPPAIPKATPEVDAVVDAWWQEFMPLYKDRNLDAMNAMMDAVFAEHPDLVPYLGLHDECLLEWQAYMCRAGRRAELVDRLLRLRRDFPVVYDQIFQYLDPTLATSLIVCGRGNEVRGILDRFTAYPDRDADYLAKLLHVLQVANRQDDVFALARATAVPNACSLHVIGYGPTLAWLELEAIIPALERREVSDEAAAAIVHAHDALGLPFPHRVTPDSAKESLVGAFAPLDWAVLSRRPKREHDLEPLFSHLWVWLHDTQGLSWATAAFFADQLRAFCVDSTSTRAKIRDPLTARKSEVEAYICEYCRDMFYIDGVRALSLLQALWSLTDFMVAAGQRTDEQVQSLRTTCRDLEGELRKGTDASDDGLLLFDTFPEYKFARRR